MDLFRRRSGYTLISKQFQVLDHHNEQTETSGTSCATENHQYRHTRQSPGHPSPGSPISVQSDTHSSTPSSRIDPTIYLIYGYRYSTIRSIFFHFASILLLGIPYLLISWFPTFISLKYKLSDLKLCDFIFVTNNRGQTSIEKVFAINLADSSDEIIRLSGTTSSNKEIRLFLFEHVRYYFNNELEQFVRLKNIDEESTVNNLLHRNSNGITPSERTVLLQLYGKNDIEITIKSYWELFRSEVINPFYLFQIFSITLWCLDEYYYYAGCVFFLSGVSIFTSLYETRKQSKTLHMLIESLKADIIQIVQPTDELSRFQPSFEKEESAYTIDFTTIISDKNIENISPDYLVPGDIIVLPADGGIMACDAVLMSGSCIVDESMLTGESVPVTKTPPNPSNRSFEWASHKRHILYAGTTILQTRYYGNEKVLARVVRSGFNTSKGELIKSILYPQPIGFKFYEDSVKFVTALFCIAIFGMIYCVRLYLSRNTDIETVLLRTLDIITIVVPPALPLAMTAGTVYSQARLKQRNIFCISPQRINICGKLKLVCFDKTGTLTDNGLTMYGCIESRDGSFVSHDPKLPRDYDNHSIMVQTLATCHSLTTINGSLNGDPLDIEMFHAIDWELSEPGDEHTRFDNLAPTIVRPKSEKRASLASLSSPSDFIQQPYLIGIIKQHQFSSEAQCMSVIVRVLGENHMKVFSKGAPERIHSFCKPETMPENYYVLLNRYTSRGYRVIAMAYKDLSSKTKWRDVERMKRHEVETDLTFVGFLILMNCLKPETTEIIEQLHTANLRTVMITGDNIMTALSVAKDCKIIRAAESIYVIRCVNSYDTTETLQPQLTIELCRDIGSTNDENDQLSQSEAEMVKTSELPASSAMKYHFALDGYTWNIIQLHYPEFIPNIVARGTIFARFRPEQKSQIVLWLQQFDYIVAMCGDGANDCGALKAAHIGISLSQAEASVAAPFTSKEQNISCVKYLALEGRCALVTSFGLFKYMTMYSLIQFCTILILYSQCSILGNFQFLYIDLIITASLAFTMGRQGPANKLVAQRPSSSLISLANVIPLLLQVLLCAFIQIGSLSFLYEQDWFITEITYDSTLKCNFDNSTMSLINEDYSVFEQTLCWENTVLFLISCFQYLILGVIYSKGPPYRQPIYTNWLLVTIVSVLTVFTVFLLVRPPDFIADIFEIEPYSIDHLDENLFRIVILAFPLLHLLFSSLIEFLIVDRRWFKSCIHFVTGKTTPKNKFKKIDLEILKSKKNWLDILNAANTSCTPIPPHEIINITI